VPIPIIGKTKRNISLSVNRYCIRESSRIGFGEGEEILKKKKQLQKQAGEGCCDNAKRLSF
jgi:hypothetical protein